MNLSFFPLFFISWRLITLQYCSGFCHTLTWISLGFTCVLHPEPPSHLPPHPIPLGHPSAAALSTLSHVSNLGWRSVSHLIIYMFQCYSLRSSHLTFSHRVQKSVLYICVSFSVLHIGLSLPSFWIPYICISILYWCLSFWLTSLCIMGSSFNGWTLKILYWVKEVTYYMIHMKVQNWEVHGDRKQIRGCLEAREQGVGHRGW